MMILYVGDSHFSGWSMRGRIAVAEKGVPVVERLVELDWPTTERADGVLVVGDAAEEREAHFGCECEAADLRMLDTEGLLEGTPALVLPRVPILADPATGTVACDVLSIAEYLDWVGGDSPVRLLGDHPQRAAVIRSVCGWATHDLGHLVYGASYAKSLRPTRSEQPAAAAVEQAGWVCDTVAKLLELYGGPFAVGEFSLADVMLSTYFQQITGWGLPVAEAAVARYRERLLGRPSVAAHLHQATVVYRAIERAAVGTPAWVVAHYRYNPAAQLLHDWQSNRCEQLGNPTAAQAVALAYDGLGVNEIAARLAQQYAAPLDRVTADVTDLFSRLAPA